MLNILLFFVYIIIMIFVGILGARKTKTAAQFAIGTGKAGAVFSAFAYGTTYFSAVMFTLCGSLGVQYGISVALIGVGNAIIGGWLAWKLLAKKTKQYSQEQSSLTFTQLLATYYDSRLLKIILAFVVLIFLVPYSASVYQGLSFIFESAFGISFVYCALILAATTAVYVFLGGYIASMANAVVQGFITVIAVLVFYFVFFHHSAIGSVHQALSTLASIDPALAAPLGPKPVFVLCTVFLTSFGAWGLPQMVQKFFGVDETKIQQSAVYSTLFCLLIAAGMYFSGGLSRVFFVNTGQLLPQNLDKVMPQILFSVCGEVLFAVMFIMLIASSMSTLSSITLVSASSFMEDILKGICTITLPEKKKLLFTRLLCLVFVAVSLALALTPNSIINLLSISWGALAGAFLAPYLYMLFGRTRDKLAAQVSTITGISTVSGGFLLWGKAYATYVGCAGIVASFIALFAVRIGKQVWSKMRSSTRT